MQSSLFQVYGKSSLSVKGKKVLFKVMQKLCRTAQCAVRHSFCITLKSILDKELGHQLIIAEALGIRQVSQVP